MNNKEVTKNIKELIETKKGLLEGDELDWVYEHDINVLENALNAITNQPKGVWVATMDSEHYDWIATGRTKEEAINALVTEWNKSIERITMTREEIEEYYGINCEFINYGSCEWR